MTTYSTRRQAKPAAAAAATTSTSERAGGATARNAGGRTLERRELMDSMELAGFSDSGAQSPSKTAARATAGRRGHPRRREPSRPEPKKAEEDPDEVLLKSALDKQSNLLALAADAARHNGDATLAQTLYLESADAAMDRLRLDVNRLKKKSGLTEKRRTGGAGGKGDRRDWSEWYNSEYRAERGRNEGWAGVVAGYKKDRLSQGSGGPSKTG